MTKLIMQQYVNAGGIASANIVISDVTITKQPEVFTGTAQLPLFESPQKVVIYQMTLPNGLFDIRAVPARCPHQGADISHDKLQPDGNVYCSLHRRPICIYSEYNQAYRVEIRDGNYIIPATV